MARRSREGLADDLLAVALKLPWWVGIGIAVVRRSVNTTGLSAAPLVKTGDQWIMSGDTSMTNGPAEAPAPRSVAAIFR